MVQDLLKHDLWLSGPNQLLHLCIQRTLGLIYSQINDEMRNNVQTVQNQKSVTTTVTVSKVVEPLLGTIQHSQHSLSYIRKCAISE